MLYFEDSEYVNRAYNARCLQLYEKRYQRYLRFKIRFFVLSSTISQLELHLFFGVVGILSFSKRLKYHSNLCKNILNSLFST